MQEDLRAALASIAAEWDKAEGYMKLAERVRAEVVLPSVNELRYAGRRLVDAWAIAAEAESSEAKRQEFDGYVRDAVFRCHCAQHDAIDATVLFVQMALAEYEEEFGLGPLMLHFPDVADLRLSLAEAGDLIINSRANRGQRAAEYDRLAKDHLPTIMLTYRKIQTNRKALSELVTQTAAKDGRDGQRFRWGLVWAAIIAIVAAAGGYGLSKVDPLKVPTTASSHAATATEAPPAPLSRRGTGQQ